MPKWVKKTDISRELGIAKDAVNTLIANGKIRVVDFTAKQKYYILPDIEPIPLDPPIERVAFLTLLEIGEILGIGYYGVKSTIQRKKLKAHREKGRFYVSVRDFRHHMAMREKRRGPGKASYSPIIVKWLKRYLETSKKMDSEILDELLRSAVPLKEPQRGIYAAKLWNAFDSVNALLAEIERLKAEGPQPKPQP